MKKQKKYNNFYILALVGIGLLLMFSLYFFQKGFKTSAMIGFLASVSLLAFIFYTTRSRSELPFQQAMNNYLKYMEKNHRISISPFAEIEEMVKEKEKYVAILHETKDGQEYWYPFEHSLYEDNIFGRVGQVFKTLSQAQYWFNNRETIDVKSVLAKAAEEEFLADFIRRRKEVANALKPTKT